LPQFERQVEDIQERKVKEEREFLEKEISRCNNLLTNEGYLAKAPRELIEKEKKKLFMLQNRYEELELF
jgi:valyl-tRNA synthetase